MADNRPHFEIPPERVRTATIRVRGQSRPYSRPNYSAHADFLRERTAAIKAHVDGAADASAAEALFLQVKTPPELPARGERQRLKSAGLEIVALSPIDPHSATVQLPRSGLNDLQRRLHDYGDTPENRGKSYLAVIEDIGPVPVEEKLAPELMIEDNEPRDCLLIFYSSLSDRERAAILLAVRSFMSRASLPIEAERRLSNGVTLVEARLRPSEAREVGIAFTTLRQVVPNHVFLVPDGYRISSVSPAVTVRPPVGTTSVAVVDSGVGPACAGVASAVVATFPQLPTGSVRAHAEHGTFVGSRVLYGDDLERSLRSGILTPRCPLVDIPVFGANASGNFVPIHEGHLASAIDAVVPMLPDTTRVINLSVGTGTPTVDGQVSVVAQLLDKHAREKDLVVVTTAGNIRDRRLLAQYPAAHVQPACRIDSPGDSLLSLTVGSIAKFHDSGALSGVRELSAFSRRGPGPFGGVKPDVVAHGGNCMPDGSTSARIGVHGLSAGGGSWECDFGTSFAAPLVSGMAAELFDHYPNATGNLVRGLLLHFTQPVISPSIACQQEHLVGFGEPDLEAAKWSSEHAAAFLHSGVLTTATHSFLPFFVPACLAAGGGGRLQIKITVVISPPVSPDNQLEYSRARVTLGLRKPTEVGSRAVGVSSDTVESDKWSPVTQLLRNFSHSYETGEWELQLRLWARNEPTGFQQPFAAIIEVLDSTGTQPVREAVGAEVGESYRMVSTRAAA
jgi:subtilisin family serine protease